MTKDEEILRLKERIFELEEENEALKKRLDFARGVPAEDFVAELTRGVHAGYKDGHDVITEGGHHLEVKLSHLNHPGSSKTKRWNWDNLLGHYETKEYDFLVLVGEKDQRYEAQYPELPYVCFVVPRGDTVHFVLWGQTSVCGGLQPDLSQMMRKADLKVRRSLKAAHRSSPGPSLSEQHCP